MDRPTSRLTLTYKRPVMARVQKGADGMNKTERAYAFELEVLKRTGRIQSYGFERIKFVLGKGSVYTPDFEVVLADGFLEYHEVKGHWREAARVRIKVAARLFSDRRFIAVKKNGAGWDREEIKP
jgi:hypothetical protein